VLKKHCRKLVGIEPYEPYAKQARKAGYDEVVSVDVRKADLPEADAVVMLDFIEHIPKREGLNLIKTLQGRVKMMIVTTPSRFHDNMDVVEETGNQFEKHVSHWSSDDLKALGFSVGEVMLDDVLKAVYGNLLFAVWRSS
jgi:hypothetical protein